MKKSFLFLIAVVWTLYGCDNVISQNLSFDDVEYVSEFPKQVELEKTDPIDLDLMGCVDFFGNDSILVFKMMNMDYHWEVYSFPNLNKKMNLLKKGKGPNEFIYMPSNEYFFEKGNLCQVWSSNERKVHHIDISKSLKTGQLQIDTIYKLPLKGTALNCVSIGDSSYFVVLNQVDSYRRCIWNGNDFSDIEHLKPINDVKIFNDLNSMAAVRCYNQSQNKVVEACLHLNQINLYSLENDSFAKTICVGEHLTDLGRIDDKSKYRWVKYYGGVFTGHNYFAALYFNASRKKFFEGKIERSDIQVYDWNGKPLLNISIPYQVESFFIHMDKDLYVLSTMGEEECLYKYDLGDLLQKL